MRIVKTAKIEVVRPHELKVGDYVLFNRFKCKIRDIYPHASSSKNDIFLEVSQSGMDDADLSLPKYASFFRIIECEEVIVCNCCFNMLVENEGDYCERCRDAIGMECNPNVKMECNSKIIKK